ncbi:MAG: conjugal transfer protein TraI [Chitinophagaceae bacterium]|nr:MAG: conjugal transfer protein TraI [Chitinophagaceae bacterium]
MKTLPILFLLMLLSLCSIHKCEAQDIPGSGVVTGLVKRVIKAIDLEVQRLQNNTIALQNVQKVLENTESKLHLHEIAGWMQKQKDLYQHYYNELWEVKTIITDYHRIKEISEKQVALVNAYKHAWGLLQQDKHFTPEEISYMSEVYSGILNQTMEDANGLLNIVTAFTTQMDDAARMKMIDDVGNKVDENYNDLQRFNTENEILSLQRSKDANDAAEVKWMYGLP